MWNLIMHPMSTNTAYFWWTPLPQKQEIPEKMWWCFWGSRARQKYTEWVLVGCGIKFCIQQALPLRIWVKTQGDVSKIWTKKVVFLCQICQFNHYGWIILLKFYWFLNSNSQKFIVGSFSYKAHFRPQISSNSIFLYVFHFVIIWMIWQCNRF